MKIERELVNSLNEIVKKTKLKMELKNSKYENLIGKARPRRN